MKWVLCMIMAMLIFSGCGWGKSHQIMMGTYVIAHAVDIAQTREILSNENYRELNPYLKNMSPDQATIAMLTGTVGVYLLADNFPEYRTWMIAIPMSLALACVFNNWQIGVTF